MAERAVAFLISKLGSLALEEARFLGRVETQIQSLHDELEWINSFLRDADQKRRRYRRVDVWASQVRNLAYDAEDIIDLFEFEILQQQQRNVVFWCLCYPLDLFTLHKFGNQIENIKRRVGEISTNKSKYGIEDLVAGETSATRSNDGLARKERRARIEEEVDVVGFKEYIEKLVKLLTEEESQHQQLLVVSIVGMGGLGKTTLAKKVCSEVKKVCSEVENKTTLNSYALIYVSQEYTMKDLLTGAVAQLKMLTGEEEEDLKRKNEQSLRNELSDYLKKRRCLLVFDDVWKIEDWDEIKGAFLANLDEGRQQQVLLTTRNVEVAKHAGSSIDPLELEPLGDEESFKLFEQKVFESQVGSEQRHCPEDLKDLGTELVVRCHGLPLAIVVLGSLLSTKEKTHNVWSKVLESMNWQLNQGPQQCIHILAPSYIDLPYYLQSCFLYFGLFPEDHEIHSNKLIRLWVAEGFIQQRGEETLEDVAEEYLEELIGRSMIQVASRRSDGGVETCRIHDLLREFAILEAKRDKLLEVYGNNCSISLNKFRRLAIHPSKGTLTKSSSSLYHLHSFFCFSDDLQKDLWKGLYVEFNLLRVLDLEGVRTLHSLPKEIGELVLLKYLNLYGTEVRKIPDSMGNLCNLQTLVLSNTKLTHIPKEVWRMRKLRHLSCIDLESPPVKCADKVVNKILQSCSRPPRVDKLKDLQTLSLNAGSWIEGGLEKLTNLRELGIRGDLTMHTKTLTDSIDKLKKLRMLELWERRENAAPLPLVSFSKYVHLYKMILYGPLEKMPALKDFPPHLTELRLVGSHLKQDDQPMTTLEKLPKLKILLLGFKSFEGEEMICSARGFAKLENLALVGLDKLKDLEVGQEAFPCLRVFTSWQCPRLVRLPHVLKRVATLQEL